MMPGGTMSSTKASPPEIMSARLERTRISWLSSIAAKLPGNSEAKIKVMQKILKDLRSACMDVPPRTQREVLLFATAKGSPIRRHKPSVLVGECRNRQSDDN